MDPGRWAAWREASRKLGRSAIARLGTATTTIHANVARAGTRLSALASRPSRRLDRPTSARAADRNGPADRPTQRRHRTQRQHRRRSDSTPPPPRRPPAQRPPSTGWPNSSTTPSAHRKPNLSPPPAGWSTCATPRRSAIARLGTATTTIHASLARAGARLSATASWPSRQWPPDGPGPGGSHRCCGRPDATPRRPDGRTDGRSTRHRHHPGDRRRNGRRRPDGRAGRPRRPRSGPADRPTQRRSRHERQRSTAADLDAATAQATMQAAAAIDRMTEEFDHAIRAAALQTARRNAAAARTAAQKAAQLDAATAVAATRASGRRRPDGRTARPGHAHPGSPT